ncbi:MAG: hypothetical protein PUB76_00215 [Oscillospiraceae bacterium]|nr:hypothetical protein [Oscillospiraceae bacterium]
MLLKIRKKYIRAIIIKIIVIVYLLACIVRGIIDIASDKKQYVSSSSLNGYEIYLLLKEEYPNLEYDTNLEKLADGYAERLYNGEKASDEIFLDDLKKDLKNLYSSDVEFVYDYIQASGNKDALNKINDDMDKNAKSKTRMEVCDNVGIGIYKEIVYTVAFYKS